MVALLLASSVVFPQETEESFTVSGEPPLLLLRQQRLRLLRRERERRTARWQQFERLMAGRAAMPEPGFALALYYRVADDGAAGRRAVEWAAGPGASDVRQVALVFDWCRSLLSDAETAALAAKLRRALETPPVGRRVSEARNRALAAVALADRAPALSQRELRRLVVEWWRGQIVPAIRKGRDVLPQAETYALFEMLHAIRDNLDIDLRESMPQRFRQAPLVELLSYYPASYPTAETEYRIPAVRGAEPDLRLATMSRAAEMAMVALDVNLQENQFLQGWLMHDRFLLRTALGIPYEFLWANPYQPGLSYHNLPLTVHDDTLGRVFMRSSWDDDAEWLGYFGGQLQTFSNGEPKILTLGAVASPMRFGDAVVVSAARFQVEEDVKTVYVVGLTPSRAYKVEPELHELHEAWTDPGGVLDVEFPNGFRGAIWIAPVQP
jgi:hypothetical protein